MARIYNNDLAFTQKHFDTQQAHLSNMENSLRKTRGQIIALQEKEKAIESRICECKEKIAADAILNAIHTMKPDDIYYASLMPETKTVQLLTKFVDSKKPFLILISRVRIGLYAGDLIIVKSQGHVKSRSTGMTMTDIKKAGTFTPYTINNYADPDSTHRLTALCCQLKYLMDKGIQSGKTYHFNIPVALGGQTESNRTGYGNNFSIFDDDFVQGTLYGETTPFLVVGVSF